jgi:hypothetical protein
MASVEIENMLVESEWSDVESESEDEREMTDDVPPEYTYGVVRRAYVIEESEWSDSDSDWSTEEEDEIPYEVPIAKPVEKINYAIPYASKVKIITGKHN